MGLSSAGARYFERALEVMTEGAALEVAAQGGPGKDFPSGYLAALEHVEDLWRDAHEGDLQGLGAGE